MQKKLVMLFMAIILAFVVLIGRITYINAIQRKQSIQRLFWINRQYDSRVIPYKRGDIVDRNGTKIATSERVYNVILDVVGCDCPREAIYIESYKGSIVEECFGINSEEVCRYRSMLIIRTAVTRYLQKGVTYEEAQEISGQLTKMIENYPNVKGVWLEDDYKRNYPYATSGE